jgi:hypothetical protein
MRRKFAWLLLVLVILGGGSAVAWWWAEGRLQAGFAAWRAAAQAQGWTVQAAQASRSGWPFAVDLDLDGLTIAADQTAMPGGGGYTAEHAVLHVAALHPDQLDVRLTGTQRLRGFGAEEVPFTADRLHLTSPLTAPGPVRLDGSRFRFAAPLEGMTVGLLQATARPAAAPGDPIGFTVTAEAIELPPPPARQPALGNRIASATVEGSLDGTLPPLGPDMAAWAAAWQRGGGGVKLRHVAIGWGPLGLSGSAALGLDPALQPAGTATLRLVGYDATLAQLTEHHALTSHQAQAIRAVLSLLARTPEGGGAPEVELPLQVHAGSVSVGEIPVGRMPNIVWPTAR